MCIENNIALVKSFYKSIEANDYDAAKSMCHRDFTFYSQVDTPLDVDGFIVQEKGNMDGFPRFQFRIHEIFAQEDKVACYMTFEGIHSAMMNDLAPTNKSVRISVMMLLTIKDGKIKEKRAHFDKADMLKQLQ
ncbi:MULTISPECIES: ester cyclase [Shewanella]|uniref:ester cyclase n=1 Tax=Shewanella TaxID=22 RepID=UPI001AAC8CD3|nr:ester cyclase [Shewanella algae]MBO2615663.1 ester cyclase [Shewanella algae]